MKRFALFFVLAVSFTASSMAQDHPVQAYFGYAHETGDVGKNGWNLSGTYGLAPHFSAEVDFGGYYGSHQHSTLSDNTHTFTIGPRIQKAYKKSHWVPYGHLLFGFGHNHDGNRVGSQGSTAFALLLGAGTDYNFSKKIAATIKADLVHTRFFYDGQTNLRVGLGIAYRFGQ